MLQGKHIVLGVTGGIAAYKCAMVTREFVKAGAEVQVVMTPAAKEFITPLTFATLSRRPVLVEMFPRQQQDHWTKHIELGLWADVFLVAPATANTIAKLAHGFADNFLTTLALAMRAPIVIAPAMDMDMYLHEATQANITVLRQRGCHIVDPEQGDLASGLSGPGRLPEPGVLVEFVDALLGPGASDLAGRHVLVTAGPTHEPLDPVRYLSNASSGKMGYALASASVRRGGRVTLISGPVYLYTPPGVERIDVTSALEMREAVMKKLPAADVIIAAAAVSDFAPVDPARSKIKRDALGNDVLMLQLKHNPDILKEAGERKRPGQILVGFALETERGVENARKKLVAKHLDMIVLNTLGEEGAGFGVDTNIVTLLGADGSEKHLPRMSKPAVAEQVLDHVVQMLGSTPA